MIRSIFLGNFKSFTARADVHTKQISLIYGANSSGKSSIVQSLLLLKQSLSGERAGTEPLSFRGIVDLGGFQNIISSHDTGRRLTLGVGIGKAADRSETDLLNRELGICWELSFNANTGGSTLAEFNFVESGDDIVLARYIPLATTSTTVRESKAVDQFQTNASFDVLALAATSRGDSVTLKSYYERIRQAQPEIARHLTRTIFRFEGTKRDELSKSANSTHDVDRTLDFLRERQIAFLDYTYEQFLDDVDQYNRSVGLGLSGLLPTAQIALTVHDLIPLFDEFNLIRESAYRSGAQPMFDLQVSLIQRSRDIAAAVRAIAYLGPLREFPLRTYLFGNSANQKLLSSTGSNAGELMYVDENLIERVSEYASTMGIGYSVFVRKAQDPQFEGLYSIRLVDEATGTDVGLADVGFGVSQVLPILVQCALPASECVVIEQPEIHLNPRLQATLGGIIGHAAAQTGKQFILETHSEHILLRLQRLIRTGVLTKDQVGVYFVSKERSGSAVMELELAGNGDLLDAWPDGFFDDTYRELFS